MSDQLDALAKAAILEKLQSPETAVQLQALNTFYTEGPETRRQVQELLRKNLVPLLMNLIYTGNEMIRQCALGALNRFCQYETNDRELVIKQYVVYGVSSVIQPCRGRPRPKQNALEWLEPLKKVYPTQENNSVLNGFVRELPLLAGTRYTPLVHAIIGVCIAFYYFSSKEMPVRIDVLIDLGLLSHILKLLLFKEPRTVLLGLETLTTIADCSLYYAATVCEMGILSILPKLLKHECITVSNSSLTLLRKIIGSCPISLLRKLLESPLMSPLVNKLDEKEEKVRKEAAHILTAFIKYGEEEEVWRLVIVFNIMKRYFRALFINDDENVRNVLEGMSFILRYSVTHGMTKKAIYCIEATHALPRIKYLSGHKSYTISEMANDILREHFPN